MCLEGKSVGIASSVLGEAGLGRSIVQTLIPSHPPQTAHTEGVGCKEAPSPV